MAERGFSGIERHTSRASLPEAVSRAEKRCWTERESVSHAAGAALGCLRLERGCRGPPKSWSPADQSGSGDVLTNAKSLRNSIGGAVVL